MADLKKLLSLLIPSGARDRERALAELERNFGSTGALPDLSAREVECAVLFANVRGFGRRCESLSPMEAHAAMQTVLTPMVTTVLERGGVVDKFLGAGMLAIFGAPVPMADAAGAAVEAARTMVSRAKSLPTPWDLSIGAAFGTVVAGTVGTDERREYTVVGDTVNVAAGLERLTREAGGPILVDAALAKRAGLSGEDLGSRRVHGREAPVGVVRVR